MTADITYEETPNGTLSTTRYLWLQEVYDQWCVDLDDYLRMGLAMDCWHADERIEIMGMPMVIMRFTWGPWP